MKYNKKFTCYRNKFLLQNSHLPGGRRFLYWSCLLLISFYRTGIATVKKRRTNENGKKQCYSINNCKEKKGVHGAQGAKGLGFHTYRVLSLSIGVLIAGGLNT